MTRSRRLVFALALGLPALFALFSASGCAGALMMPYYLIYGTDAPAVFKDEM